MAHSVDWSCHVKLFYRIVLYDSVLYYEIWISPISHVALIACELLFIDGTYLLITAFMD